MIDATATPLTGYSEVHPQCQGFTDLVTTQLRFLFFHLMMKQKLQLSLFLHFHPYILHE
jgi:hypothetical protein